MLKDTKSLGNNKAPACESRGFVLKKEGVLFDTPSFPDLLFGTLREDGPVYFDATRFIQAKGDARRHNVRDFRVAFHHWATALADAYGIDREKMIIRDEASGHLLIDECLALLFVVYIDPAFGVYLLERVDELLSGGFTVSDTWLVQAAGLRFTKEELTQILEQHETQHI